MCLIRQRHLLTPFAEPPKTAGRRCGAFLPAESRARSRPKAEGDSPLFYAEASGVPAKVLFRLSGAGPKVSVDFLDESTLEV